MGCMRQVPKSALHHKYTPLYLPRLFLYIDIFIVGLSNIPVAKIGSSLVNSSCLTGSKIAP